MVKFKHMLKFNTSVILQINQSKKLVKSNFQFLALEGGQNSRLMHVPLYSLPTKFNMFKFNWSIVIKYYINQIHSIGFYHTY